MLRRTLLHQKHMTSRYTSEKTQLLWENRTRKRQAAAVPHKLAISFGGEKKPIAFLPRQPIEADETIFPEGAAKTIYDAPIVEFDDADPTTTQERQKNGNNNNTNKQNVQIPIARLESPRLGLPSSLLKKLKSEEIGVTSLTPVQAKMLQRAYLLHDCAVSAETGSGKTFGLCIALIAKLLRNGPNRPMTGLFLVPSDTLVHQVAQWITELWPYEIDKKNQLTKDVRSPQHSGMSFHLPNIHNSIVATIYSTERPFHAYRRLIARRKEDTPVDTKVIVATPENFWEIFEIRRRTNEAVFARHEEEKKELVKDILSAGGKNSLTDIIHLGYVKKTIRKTHLKPIMPLIDTIVVDEADVVLPPTDNAAPGNMLLQELTNPVRFKSPIQLLINSATLSATTITHLRKFLRKNVFASATSRIFEGDSQDERNYKKDLKQKEANTNTRNTEEDGDSAFNDFVGSSKNTSVTAPSLQLSEAIHHRFLAADNADELKRHLRKVFSDFMEKYPQPTIEEQQQQDRAKMVEDSTNHRDHHQSKVADENSTNNAKPRPKIITHQEVDEDGYSVLVDQEVALPRQEEKLIETVDLKESDERVISTAIPRKPLPNKSSKRKSEPKMLLIFPEELNFDLETVINEKDPQHQQVTADLLMMKDKNTSGYDDNSDDDDQGPIEGEFFAEQSMQVVCSGNLKRLSQLEEIVVDLEREFFGTTTDNNGTADENASVNKASDDNPRDGQNTHLRHRQFPIIALSQEQVRGFDNPDIRTVIILSKSETVKEFVHWSGRVGRMGEEGEAIHILSRTWMKNTGDFCERLGLKFKAEKIN